MIFFDDTSEGYGAQIFRGLVQQTNYDDAKASAGGHGSGYLWQNVVEAYVGAQEGCEAQQLSHLLGMTL
ncbi:MAG: hypothetical protein NVS2B12_15890 [Ktedonobacteraceae bacterium]